MSWADRWWRIALTVRIGGREHRAANPWRISLTTTWPRALFQCLFFTLLGRVVGGDDGAAYMFIGSLAIIVTLFTISELGDVPMRDRWSAAFYRLRLGRLPIPVVYTLRAWPMVVEGALMAAVCLLVVGVITGQGGLVRSLLPVFPFYLVMVATSAATGLATASVGLFGRNGADTLVNNIAIYLIIATSGALIPLGRVPWIEAVGTVLPLRNGLEAIRNRLIGEPWGGPLLHEVAVGLGWFLVAVLSYAVLTRRVRRTDHDKVT